MLLSTASLYLRSWWLFLSSP